MRRLTNPAAVAAAIVAGSVLSHANAAPIPIANAGFEADFAADGTFPVGPVTDWPAYDPNGLLAFGGNFTGVINPTGSACFNGDAPEGNNAAILFLEGTIGAGPVGLRQELDAVLEAHTVYTLSVEVGNIASCAGLPPFDQFGFFELDGFPGYAVQLLAGGVVVAEDFNSLAGTIPEGEFMTTTVQLVVGASHPQLGGTLEIRLINLNEAETPEDPGVEVDFDDVRLDASPAACGPADLNADGVLNNTDINLFVSAFLAGDPAADLNADGVFNNTDVNLYVGAFLAGC